MNQSIPCRDSIPLHEEVRSLAGGVDTAAFWMAIRRELRRLFRIHGRGSRKRVLAAVRISPSTFDSALSRRSLKISQLDAILGQLGSNLADFFQAVLGHQPENDRPTGPPPPIVVTARDRVASEGWSRRLSVEQQDWLEGMSWQGLERPGPVSAQLEKGIRGEQPLSPWLLGVYGSCLCRLGKCREARWVLDLGIEGARELVRWHDFAALHQRLAWVDYRDGNRRKAIERLALASGIFYDLGDVQSLSQATIEQGILLTFLGDHALAAQVLERGAGVLEDSTLAAESEETLYHFSAYRFLVLCHLKLGQVLSAEESLRKAEEYLPESRGSAALLLRVLEAEILEGKGCFGRAAELHEELAEEFGAKSRPEDAALAALASLRCYLEANRLEKAEAQVHFLRGLTFGLESSNAREFADFVIAAQEGKVRKQDVLVLEERLKNEREKQLEERFFIGLY